MKKMLRKLTDRKVAGVCSGIAAYFGVDPTAIRVGTVLVCVLSGFIPVILFYAVCWMIIPVEPFAYSDDRSENPPSKPE